MSEAKDAPGPSNPMEQFLVLANSSKGLAAVELIKNVLKHPNVFVFGELLEHPNIKALESTEHKSYLELLQLFAFGTYSDYKARAKSLPELTPPQLTKLKQLSIVSLASTHKALSYKQLMTDLDVENIRELEDMIIECIYAELIFGKLDQKESALMVDHAAARDISPNDVSSMQQTLTNWLETAAALVKQLDQQQSYADKAYTTKQEEKQKFEKDRQDVEAIVKLELDDKRRVAGQHPQPHGHGPHGEMPMGSFGMLDSLQRALGGDFDRMKNRGVHRPNR